MPADEVLDMAWSDTYPGLRMRFTTPSFVRRGTLRSRKGVSMTIRMDGFDRDTVIPNAKQYWVDWKMGRTDYQLCPIALKPGDVIDDLSGIGEAIMEQIIDEQYVSVKIAANILGTDAKNVRRKLRSGALKGRQDDKGHWEVFRESIKS